MYVKQEKVHVPHQRWLLPLRRLHVMYYFPPFHNIGDGGSGKACFLHRQSETETSVWLALKTTLLTPCCAAS